MPELPEVETVRRGLETLVLGARIESARVWRASAIRLTPGGDREFTSHVQGATIAAVARRGKFLWMPLDAPAELALSAHLGMSGQFRVHEGPWADAPDAHPHCRVRFLVSRAGEPAVLDFLDQRTFGYLHVEPLVATPDGLAGGLGSPLAAVPVSVAHIGRDVLDPAWDPAAASTVWRKGTRGIKQVLLDQTKVSGIGNIYADEALWHARIHPQQPANTVSRPAAARLFDAVGTVMESALTQGGTSFDSLYVNVNGESGYFARDLVAYGRATQPCRRCGSRIAREVISGRSTHWCPRCQRVNGSPTPTSQVSRESVNGTRDL